MKTIINIIALLLILAVSSAAQSDYDNGNTGIVISPTGLVLRKLPSANAEKLAIMPYQSIVYFYINYSYDSKDLDKQDFVSGKSGKWRQVYYKGQFGYAFDAFLQESDNWAIAEANIYGIVNNNIPMYKANSKNSTIVYTFAEPKEIYVINKKDISKNTDKNKLIKVRYKDKMGYVVAKEIYTLEQYRNILADRYYAPK